MSSQLYFMFKLVCIYVNIFSFLYLAIYPYMSAQAWNSELQWTCLVFDQYYREIHSLTRELHVKFHAKKRYRTNRDWTPQKVQRLISQSARVL
jgi:hypothetical protein